MKTNIYYFDGVLHISIIKSKKNELEPLKSVKNEYNKLTPNHKIIDLIKKDNEDNIQIIIIVNRKQNLALKLVKKFLLRKDINIKFIKINNILLHKNVDYSKMDIDSVYDYNISNLKSIKDINNNIKIFLVNPINLEIKQINENEQIDKIRKSYSINNKDDDSSESSDEYVPKEKLPYNSIYIPNIEYPQKTLSSYTQNIKYPIINQIPITYNKFGINIGYDFDGVLHISVTKPDPNGQIHPLPHLRHSPYQMQPNQIIVKQIISQYNQGNKIFIISHRLSKNSHNTICSFLGRQDVNLTNIINCKNIYLIKGNKGVILKKMNIQTFYDDSLNVLNDIINGYSNIKLYLVSPYNQSITPYNNQKNQVNNQSITPYNNQSITPYNNQKNQVNNHNFANAVIILFCGINSDRIVMVRDKFNRKWMLPGGKIDRKDKSPFFAAAREFHEETSFKLPKLGNNIYKYKKLGHTIIYKGYTKYKFGTFRPTNETDKILYPKFRSVIDGSFEKKNGSIKSYVKNSLLKMYRDNFIP